MKILDKLNRFAKLVFHPYDDAEQTEGPQIDEDRSSKEPQELQSGRTSANVIDERALVQLETQEPLEQEETRVAEVVESQDMSDAPSEPAQPEESESSECSAIPGAPDHPELQEIPIPPTPPTPSGKSVDALSFHKPIVEPKKEYLGDNVIDVRENLLKRIIEKLKPYRGISPDTPIAITFYVSDQGISLVMKDRFEDALRTKLEDNALEALAKGRIAIKNSQAPQNDAIRVIEGLEFSFVENNIERPSGTAIAMISIVAERGSLMMAKYELDSSEKTTFHIGRGKDVTRDNHFRVNDVIINDDEDNPALANRNARTSRMHADIVWRNGAFHLQAMESGCRPYGGSPTKIYHNGIARELRNIHVLELLDDGDMIELGGADGVMLSFNVKPTI